MPTAISNGFRHPLGNGVLTESLDGDGYYVPDATQVEGGANFGDPFNPGDLSKGYHVGEDWNGEDLSDLGDPVFAASNGRVVYANAYGHGMGNVVIIEHLMPDGSMIYTLYAHLDESYLDFIGPVGQPGINILGDGPVVTKGDRIGGIGNTTGTTLTVEPHLHFEIYQGNWDRGLLEFGYSDTPRPDGWFDPTDFINSHRSLAEAPKTYSYTTIDLGTSTAAYDINDVGQIVGYLVDTKSHAFIYSINGAPLVTKDNPSGVNGTDGYGINDAGQIVGDYADGFLNHAFLYAGGTAYPTLNGRFAWDINDVGQIVGDYAQYSSPTGTAFIRSPDGGYTDIRYSGSILTSAQGINNNGEVVGYYQDATGYHGYIYHLSGTYTPYPDLDVAPGQTYLTGINDLGWIVGYYYANGIAHSFLDVNGSAHGGVQIVGDDLDVTLGVFAQGINDAGDVVGYYSDNIGTHAFLASVSFNQPPVVTGPVVLGASDEDTVRLIAAAELLAKANDVDSAALSISSLTASSGTLIDNGNGTWTFTPAVNDDTAVTFSYEVSDGTLSTPASATLDLAAVNDAPTLANAIADTTATPNQAYSLVLPANTFADVDAGDALTFTTSVLPAWLSFNPITRTFFGTPATGNVGVVNITVTGTDVAGVSISDTFSLTVSSSGSDVITGTADADVISAQGGNDLVNAGGGNDTVTGGSGSDIVTGGTGNDTFIATIGDGSDVYVGGAGTDTLSMSAMTAPLSINLNGFAFSTQTGADGLTSIENAIGGSGNDTMTGNGAANVLDGRAGNDTINAGGGADIVIGGSGNDIMNGGAGSDTFVFAPNFGNDRIQGFDANPAGGQDFLDVTAFGVSAADFATRVTIADIGADTLITVDGIDTIRLVGIGNAATITMNDFLVV